MNNQKKIALIIRHGGDKNRIDYIKSTLVSDIVDIFIIQECFNNPAFSKSYIYNNHLYLSVNFLAQENLKFFKKCGWQCGDYILYAARKFFPDYDFYWLVDDDLVFNCNFDDFIYETNKFDEDLISYSFSERDFTWDWTKSLNGYRKYKIYGMLFCILRMSAKAIDFLKKSRVEYNLEFDLNSRKNLNEYANDEVFTATLLKNNNYSIIDICKIVPELFDMHFTLTRPILIDELNFPYLKNKILHPVCSIERSREKVKKRLINKEYSSLIDRFYEVYSFLGAEACLDYFGVDVKMVFQDYFGENEILNLHTLNFALKNKLKSSYVKKIWFYRLHIMVVECDFNKIKFGLDINCVGQISISPRNIRSKKVLDIIISSNSKNSTLYKNKTFRHDSLTVLNEMTYYSSFSEKVKYLLTFLDNYSRILIDLEL